jgi:hypothetical protein
MATERELVQALTSGLAGVADVRWGWKAAEYAELPPGLPLVTVQRTVASGAAWWDMCEAEAPLVDTSIQVHTWHAVYEFGRDLNAQVRAIVLGAGGWRLSAETDDYEASFRAWRIAGDYTSIGVALE